MEKTNKTWGLLNEDGELMIPQNTPKEKFIETVIKKFKDNGFEVEILEDGKIKIKENNKWWIFEIKG